MTRPASTDDARAFFNDVFLKGEPPASARFAGWTLVEMDFEAMALTVDFTARAEMLNPVGMVQGGMLCAMMDDTMGPLAIIMAAGRAMASSTDIHVQYFRPARLGPIRRRAEITRRGRTVTTTRAELFDGRGKVLAHGIQTAMMRAF